MDRLELEESRDSESEGNMDVTIHTKDKEDDKTPVEDIEEESLSGGGDTGRSTVGEDTLAANTENDEEEMSMI